jgi:hypothetical protein
VRFYGTVIPAKDGTRLRLYEPGPFGGRKIAETTLRHNNKASSKFSLKVHVRKSGEYSVSVPADAANEHGGGFITLHVHRRSTNRSDRLRPLLRIFACPYFSAVGYTCRRGTPLPTRRLGRRAHSGGRDLVSVPTP